MASNRSSRWRSVSVRVSATPEELTNMFAVSGLPTRLEDAQNTMSRDGYWPWKWPWYRKVLSLTVATVVHPFLQVARLHARGHSGTTLQVVGVSMALFTFIGVLATICGAYPFHAAMSPTPLKAKIARVVQVILAALFLTTAVAIIAG